MRRGGGKGDEGKGRENARWLLYLKAIRVGIWRLYIFGGPRVGWKHRPFLGSRRGSALLILLLLLLLLLLLHLTTLSRNDRCSPFLSFLSFPLPPLYPSSRSFQPLRPFLFSRFFRSPVGPWHPCPFLSHPGDAARRGGALRVSPSGHSATTTTRFDSTRRLPLFSRWLFLTLCPPLSFLSLSLCFTNSSYLFLRLSSLFLRESLG